MRKNSRLILNVLCSALSLFNGLAQVFLYLTSRLNPLLTILANTLLGFFWVAIIFYQSASLTQLKRILDNMCPMGFRSRFLWCQNPKMTLSFSILCL